MIAAAQPDYAEIIRLMPGDTFTRKKNDHGWKYDLDFFDQNGSPTPSAEPLEDTPQDGSGLAR